MKQIKEQKTPILKDLTPGIHYDLEIENAILGACMLESDAFPRVRNLLDVSMFFSEKNQIAWSAIQEIWEEGMPIDLLIVVRRIYDSSLQIKFDNVAYELTVKTNAVVSSANLEVHALLCRQLYAKRKLLELQMEAGSGIDNPLGKMNEMQDQIKRIMDVNATDDWMDMSKVMIKLSHRMDAVSGVDQTGIPMGFPKMDKVCGGMEGGELIIIGARPSVGKTAFSADLVLSAAMKGYNVGIVNMEMPDVQLGARILSKFSKTEFWRIWRSKFASNQQSEYLYSKMGDLANLPIQISDKTNLTASDIRAKALKLKKRGKLDLLVIDYLQLMEGDSSKNTNREQEVSKISRGLKLLAMEMNIPVIALAQLSRESEKSPDKKPRMSNLRESGSLEQDADKVVLIHRDWKSGITTDANGDSTEDKAQIIWDKNRNGECGAFDVSFDPETITFYESI